MKLSKAMKKTGMGVLFAVSIFGCGSAANDQGISFAFAGFGAYSLDDATGGFTCSTTTIMNTITTRLGDNVDGTASVTPACLLLQNNMTGVSIRTERAEISYYIPGAEEQPPTTSVPAFTYLAPAASVSATPTTGGSSSVPSIGIGTLVSMPVNIVPGEISSWLSLNRNKLPEAPFSMDVVVHVLGVTTAGADLQTNDGSIQVQVVSDFVINGDGTSEADVSATPTP